MIEREVGCRFNEVRISLQHQTICNLDFFFFLFYFIQKWNFHHCFYILIVRNIELSIEGKEKAYAHLFFACRKFLFPGTVSK